MKSNTEIAREKDAEIARLTAERDKAVAALASIGILNASGKNPDAEIDRVIRECALEQTVHTGEKT